MLRIFVAAIGLLYLVAAVATVHFALPKLLTIYLILNGLLILVGLLVERGRYRLQRRGTGHGQRTGERFVDPTTGHLIEVRYDPYSGERDYVDLGEAPSFNGRGKS